MFSSNRFNPVIVIDPGSFTCKIGFSGSQIPKLVFKTEIECSDSGQRHGCNNGADPESFTNPIQRGTIVNWSGMLNIWNRTFFEDLKVDSEEQDVLMSEPVWNPKENREKAAELLFEIYGVRSLAMPIQPLLSLYASGRLTGVVQDCGAEVCQTVPVYDGCVLGKGVECANYGGYNVTRHLGRVLATAIGFEGSSDDAIRAIKERYCYVSASYDEEMKRSSEVTPATFTLPDGRLLTLREERFRSSEGLFRPSFLGLDDYGVHEMLHRSIANCNQVHRAELYRNIVLSGGTTLLDGFPNRMRNEICRLAAEDDNVRIIAPPTIIGQRCVESWKMLPNYRKYAVWIGGSLIGSTSAFARACTHKEEYEEFGPSIVHKKVLWSS